MHGEVGELQEAELVLVLEEDEGEEAGGCWEEMRKRRRRRRTGGGGEGYGKPVLMEDMEGADGARAANGFAEMQTIPQPTAPELPEVYAELVFEEVQQIQRELRAVEEESGGESEVYVA
eukprot:757854-Hanusia_phi.AAC.1